uniref:Proline rich basic protein 1 n=1 Tax=Jaculus jaculus TaxID=51337 RepID=A0A8C5KZN7_JACJA
MLTTLAPPAGPGLSRLLSAAPARRQDSSGSSGSYHTAPGSPEPPDVGPDTQGRVNWLWVAPGRGVGAQPLLSVSAQNSRQQHCSGSGFPRGPGSGPPPPPQLRMLPSGEMEVIFSTGPLFSHSDAEDVQVQPQLTAPALSSPALQGPVSPVPAPPPPPASDGDSRWATYLELRPRGPSPAVSAQFECVEVALEECAAPVRSRTVPKRQIELRPRPRSPSQTDAPRPRLLLRTGSLDESLGRLQAAAGIVQTALAKKLGATVPAPNNDTFRPTGRSEPTAQETARSTRVVLEEARSRPPRAHQSSVPARAPKPWPSLRERAIRRDKPAPGTEQLGPVSSSIFLQSEEKMQEARNQEPKTRCPREAPDQTVPRTRSPPVQSRAPWVPPSRAVRPKSPSSPWQAPNGTNPSRRDRTVWTVSSPSFPEASSARGSWNAAIEEAVRRRSPSPMPLSQWNPPLGAPSPWEAPHPTSGDAMGRDREWSQPASHPWASPDRPTGTRSPSPQETWGPVAQGSSMASAREAMNGLAQELGPPTPSPPGTPEVTEVQSPPTREHIVTTCRASQPSPEVDAPEPTRRPVVGTLDDSPRPEASGSGEAACGRPRVAIPRPRDVRKMVKTTYAPSFTAGSPGSGSTAPPADPGGEGEDPSKSLEVRAAGPPAPAQYTSIFLKDFLPVVPHPYEAPEPSLQTVPRDAPQPSGVPRRRAENSTAKPFARTEIRLPGALALSGRPLGTPEVRGRGPSRDDQEPRDAEGQRPGPDDQAPSGPLDGARTSPRRSPVGPAGTPPPRPGSPPVCPILSPGMAPDMETPPAAPEPATPTPQAGRTAAPQPRAASAPPTDRLPSSSAQGRRRLPGAAPPGKVLVDPENGRYYFVEAPRQPRLRLLFDPESGQYVEVLLPPSSPGTPRHAYTPLALGPSLYPPAYGPIPGLSLPPSPNLPPLGSLQLPWAPDGAALNGTYYMPVSGTPSPAPPVLFCAPPSSSGSLQPSKGSVFPL